ncbi:MAG: class I mannose-6-phosphate isomerase, partial [Candidatus Latescibacteria bacterium]|nr:class I mannose-6-phosphate isomerase [Candidatus Latescibacterota bacterium]
VIFIPAGRIHTIGKNICLYEVQQTSDLTYRLWDWGRPRELHLEKGLEAIDFQFVPHPKVEGIEISTGENSRKYLIACRFFAVELLTVRTSLQERCDGRSFHILSILEGEGKLSSPEGEENIHRGESILLPAATGTYGIRASAPIRVLKSYVPDLRQDIISPLRALGKSDRQIRALGGQARSNDIAPLLE